MCNEDCLGLFCGRRGRSKQLSGMSFWIARCALFGCADVPSLYFVDFIYLIVRWVLCALDDGAVPSMRVLNLAAILAKLGTPKRFFLT